MPIELPDSFSKLINDGLAKSVRDIRRLDPARDILAQALQLPANDVAIKSVASVTSDMENRIGEWQARRPNLRAAVILLSPPRADRIDSEVQNGMRLAQELISQGKFGGRAILLFARALDAPVLWTLRATVERGATTIGDQLRAQFPGMRSVVAAGEPPQMLNPDSSPPRAVWIELTHSDHQHGGAGWEFGTCLWSPSKDRSDRDRYGNMRQPRREDMVLHILDGSLVGYSRVSSGYRESMQSPPQPGPWKDMAPYYRIDLNDYRSVQTPYPIRQLLEEHDEEIRADLREHSPVMYPFYEEERRVLRTVQGAYLRACSPVLYRILASEVGLPSEVRVAAPVPGGKTRSPAATLDRPKRVLAEDGPSFSVDDALSDVFVPRETFLSMMEILERKRNLVIEGPPGVGKTFVARRLAYALIGHSQPDRLETVQFHQSYAYEDFVRGWRPSPTGLELRNGVFLDFCLRAAENPTKRFVFIIDEINRGNLSRIFGELLMLIEGDKRNIEHAVSLAYRTDEEAARFSRFFVPPNVYIVGLMNTADRSLALVDYALRRRFGFVRLTPAFANPAFRTFLEARGVDKPTTSRIISRFTSLNSEIASDRKNLGPGFEIGHSFFCPKGGGAAYGPDWYKTVVTSEIEPLLTEYWFDDDEHVLSVVKLLLE